MTTALATGCITLVYKHVGSLDLLLDLYLPASASIERPSPILVYFHGGGLTVGDRTSWFPEWLHERLSASGVAFISAEYRLIPPSTGHDILQDVTDVFAYVANTLNSELSSRGVLNQIDGARIAVAGTSSGGLCAYLAAAHALPRPKCLLSMYGMGGDWLNSHMYTIKREPFFMGYEILDRKSFAEFFHPACHSLSQISGSPLCYHPPDSAAPGYPANPRMQLGRVYIQEGVFIDYLTGLHSPSLSAMMRVLLQEDCTSMNADASRAKMAAAIPESVRPLFPQLNVSPDWPPCLLVHGELDSAVHADESRHIYDLLKKAGVSVELRVVEGAEHSFDVRPGALEKYGTKGGLYDQAFLFVFTALSS
ncbi:Alpha/Beta hydrolase protein [Vararia minispora EC-137]|uniref:Alpha/Beta hydrolase protein n=1 Tax=Vararia minispora EC-137 TaxID=1314806 RepID=A0ACB8QM39_9AGAM|nr:Alpha/Beta hydrolase protein [Vararia minispora EC-137]